MKTVLINGSPNAVGNTFEALNIIAKRLATESIETEIIQVGHKQISGCVGCGGCAKGNCVFADDFFNESVKKMYSADAIVLGSPVYYASINGTLKSFLDRAFYSSKGSFRLKFAASVAVPRRSGGMPALEQLNSYFMISEMIVVSSSYWNVVHGGRQGEVLQDLEGIDVLDTLGKNMAWLLKMREFSRTQIPPPEKTKRRITNFIREIK